MKGNGSRVRTLGQKLGIDLIVAAGLLPCLTCSGGGPAGIGLVGGTAAGASPARCSAGQSASVTQAGVSSVASGGGSDLHARARKVDRYLANYGSWDANSVAVAKRSQLAIVHPDHAELTRAQVADIQAGVDPNDPSDDVLVLCYVSVGEDLRAAPLGDDAVRADPRFRGDGTGPRIDPRGADADGQSLDGIDPRGAPSTGGLGFASYYLDDNDVHRRADHRGDGFPDRNPAFGSLFVNAGDPNWFDVVNSMKMDSADHLPGLREVLTRNYGRGLDCDGVFLDTVDTAAPDSFTDASSPVESKFEWTAPGFGAFIRKVHEQYPNKLILQNRGLFFFDPRHSQYAYNARGAIDFVLFESFRLNSSDSEQWNDIQYPDNRYNIAPKLMAEANRPDGFKVLSLGYAEGPATQISNATLTGGSSLGMDSLLEDIHQAQDVVGFRHYLTDKLVHLVNDFVATHGNLDDHDPPVWTSTYNDHAVLPAVEPTPRVGIQAATANNGTLIVSWDVALDKSRVGYVLYAQPTPFDFGADPTLSQAKRIPLQALPSPAYAQKVATDTYANQATLCGFPSGQMQYLVIRAVDESPAANEDTNTVVLTATP